jgi:hypothetical protein
MNPVPVCLGDEFVALVCPAGAQLSASVLQLPADHPALRFVALMCLYAADVLDGRRPVPYSDAAAAAWARRQALPVDVYHRALAAGASAETIAARLCLPVEQVQARALDADVVRRRRGWRYTRDDGPTHRRVSVRGGRVRITHQPRAWW